MDFPLYAKSIVSLICPTNASPPFRTHAWQDGCYTDKYAIKNKYMLYLQLH